MAVAVLYSGTYFITSSATTYIITLPLSPDGSSSPLSQVLLQDCLSHPTLFSSLICLGLLHLFLSYTGGYTYHTYLLDHIQFIYPVPVVAYLPSQRD